MMRRGECAVWAAWVLAGVLLGAPALAAEDENVVGEVLEILKERGLVDDQEYERLSLKNAAYEQQHESEGFMSRIEWSGDMRLRLENFWYDRDPVADEQNQTRGRYRLRLKGVVPINEYVKAGFRFASGQEAKGQSGRNAGDPRSTNRTLGRDNDFGNDGVYIDQAYITLKAPGDWLGEASKLSVTGGKMSNPFTWKNGKDYMIWDHDITPEGVGGKLEYRPSELWTLFANAGYFIDDENSSSRDPHVLGLQGGFGFDASEDVELGGRLSWYEWASLDDDFLMRGASFGNTLFTDAMGVVHSGLTDDSISAGEISAYVRYNGIEDWPLLVYGSFAQNFDAESLFDPVTGDSAGDEDTGWGVGAEIGDKKKYVKVGVGYYQLEANYIPAMMFDSDLTDGVTNRKAWTLYFSRQILADTDLSVTFFKSNDLERGPLFATSVAGSDRYRLQTDLQVKF
jgi:hypothetical protein